MTEAGRTAAVGPDPWPEAGSAGHASRLEFVRQADAYLDAVPRGDAEAIEVGPFTLFRTRGVWNYYARPTPNLNQPVTLADLVELDRVCQGLGLPLSLEWLPDCCPTLESAVVDYGLTVHEYVLMTLLRSERAPGDASSRTARLPAGMSVRLLQPDDPAVPAARAVADVSFGVGGTAAASVGLAERAEMLQAMRPEVVSTVRSRMAAGKMVLAVAEHDTDGVVGSGAYQPVGDVAEIVGVATLPYVRRRGLATAISSLLADAAFASGVRLVLLSAGSEDIARVYTETGFRRIARSLAAEPPDSQA
jgi:N-acetylglutamate synthase-like GNAT family acetyltransferase